MSQLFFQTLRDTPSEARTPGYAYLLRAGFLRSLAGGASAAGQRDAAFLPLGEQVRTRVEDQVCAALGLIPAQMIALPRLRGLEAGETLPAGAVRVRFGERSGRDLVAEDSHAGVFLALAGGMIRSYRQLPLWLYEIWQPMGDDDRQTGGLLGARESRVLDLYGLLPAEAELDAAGERIGAALGGLSAAWNLGAVSVISAETDDHRPVAQKLVLPWDGGDVTVARCENCGYAAEQSLARVASGQSEPEEALPLEDVETPHCRTIAELAAFLGIPESRTAKVIFLVANSARDGDRFLFVVVRGDTALNEEKLKAALGLTTAGPATEAEIRQAGAEPGYGSPLGITGATVIVDRLAASSPNLVAGANRPGFHTRNVNCGRDFQTAVIADIALAQAGSPCPVCGSPLALEQGITLAETKRENAAGAASATYLDASGRSQPLLLATARVYLDRVLAATAEQYHDGQGLVWPPALAPYTVYLLTLGKGSAELSAAAARLYAELTAAGIAVLFDDRDERAGVKFNDADLIGLPFRVALGERGLQSGTAEVKRRSAAEVENVPIAELASHLAAALSGA
ncbi:MAG TPA: YbaK/EbsC family protein [Anaerolineae bacterium]